MHSFSDAFRNAQRRVADYKLCRAEVAEEASEGSVCARSDVS
jgi:hypothetical protein